MTTVAFDISTYLKEKAKIIELHLEEILIPAIPHRVLIAAAHYSLFSGGKRLRPLLAMASAETFGVEIDKILNTACAFELIHTYSLIHDDLPCMDDDDFRRGKPTLHKAFDEATAVLAGDFLHTYAFDIIASDISLAAEQKVALVELLARNAGAHGMIGGQMMDIQAENCSISMEELQRIHDLKTGKLIKAAMMAGGIVGNASEKELNILGLFGQEMGLAFQIIDDVIDVTAGVEKHGKAGGSDALRQKTTYVTLLGVDAARENASRLYNHGCALLDDLDRDTAVLKALACRMVYRTI